MNLTLVQKKILKYNQLLLEFFNIHQQERNGKIDSIKEKVQKALKMDFQNENLHKLQV